MKDDATDDNPRRDPNLDDEEDRLRYYKAWEEAQAFFTSDARGRQSQADVMTITEAGMPFINIDQKIYYLSAQEVPSQRGGIASYLAWEFESDERVVIEAIDMEVPKQPKKQIQTMKADEETRFREARVSMLNLLEGDVATAHEKKSHLFFIRRPYHGEKTLREAIKTVLDEDSEDAYLKILVLVSKAATVLEEAHSHNIIHGNISADSFVVSEDESGNPEVHISNLDNAVFLPEGKKFIESVSEVEHHPPDRKTTRHRDWKKTLGWDVYGFGKMIEQEIGIELDDDMQHIVESATKNNQKDRSTMSAINQELHQIIRDEREKNYSQSIVKLSSSELKNFDDPRRRLDYRLKEIVENFSKLGHVSGKNTLPSFSSLTGGKKYAQRTAMIADILRVVAMIKESPELDASESAGMMFGILFDIKNAPKVDKALKNQCELEMTKIIALGLGVKPEAGLEHAQNVYRKLLDNRQPRTGSEDSGLAPTVS